MKNYSFQLKVHSKKGCFPVFSGESDYINNIWMEINYEVKQRIKSANKDPDEEIASIEINIQKNKEANKCF